MNLLVGVTLVALAAGVLAYSLQHHQAGSTLLAAGGLLLGLAVAVCSSIARGWPARRPAPDLGAPPSGRRTPANGAGRPPLLGELLVCRYGVITEQQLALALAGQRGTTKRLGEMLLEMRLIDTAVLEVALAYQRSYRDPWRRASRR